MDIYANQMSGGDKELDDYFKCYHDRISNERREDIIKKFAKNIENE